ncbi:SRPBCC family protein [Geopsychrobacter electrodiphilus]|uniref:SRPBCC family protein n=1 Tax=Geopsychrobacter electrodiphilus TaxID=225196 RepID=UPI000373912E|nr:SRPBCC family protein [Geopsychrobacter electrodiphilus]
MYQLEREMILNAPAQEVWDFLANPVNLNELTPPDLHFEILSRLPERMFNGLTIHYAIGIPLFGRHLWLTEIKHIKEGHSFVDEQRCGPYRFWYHYHAVESMTDDRTRMIDRVTYQLPFGLLGRLVHSVQVKKMLAGIFDYRSQKLTEIFS